VRGKEAGLEAKTPGREDGGGLIEVEDVTETRGGLVREQSFLLASHSATNSSGRCYRSGEGSYYTCANGYTEKFGLGLAITKVHLAD